MSRFSHSARRQCILILMLTVGILCGARGARAQSRWSQEKFRQTLQSKKIHPQWLPHDAALWYAVEEQADKWSYVRIDTATGEKATNADPKALDLLGQLKVHTSKLNRSSKTRSGSGGAGCSLLFVNQLAVQVSLSWLNFDGGRVHYATVAPGAESRLSTYAGHLWQIEDPSGKVIAVVDSDPRHPRVVIDGTSLAPADVQPPPKGQAGLSPDGLWHASIRGTEVALREIKTDHVTQLSAKLPAEARFHGAIVWSPKSEAFVVSAAVPIPIRQLTLIQSSPPNEIHPKLTKVDYRKPGDDLPQPVPVLFRLDKGTFQATIIDHSQFPQQYCTSTHHDYHWAEDGHEFYFDVNSRGHQRYQILAVDLESADVRPVVDETSKTFIDYNATTWRHWLPTSGELLWTSERSGWCHLWRIDVSGQRSPQQVTTGDWVVREVLHVDAASETILFTANGLRSRENPYHIHLCRVKFDGTEFRQLTDGDGMHEIDFSPEHRYFVDTYSRVDQPPIVELRRTADGSLVAQIEQVLESTFHDSGYQAPERFVAKGRDGKTDIYGVIVKPSNFDPAKKYPVLEEVYAGPHSAHAPQRFGSHARLQAFAEAGFIVVQADGMGTNYRGKAFHDVCWKNLQDAGFPDRIAWIKAAAASRPWMDLSRVGIMGGSAGGQNAMRALIDHSDFYHVAVADCGCHDNRVDKLWWNEQWMGWPLDDSYLRSSNTEHAARLRGKLLLIVGELDNNVDPASTYQTAGALQRAGKQFDMMTIINAGHGAAETPAGSRLRQQFLINHLQPETASR